MITGFIAREKVIEDKFQQGELKKFKITARRNRLFGLWVAKQLGYDEAQTESFAHELMLSYLDDPSSQSLLCYAHRELTKKSIAFSSCQLEKELEYFSKEAARQMMKEQYLL